MTATTESTTDCRFCHQSQLAPAAHDDNNPFAILKSMHDSYSARFHAQVQPRVASHYNFLPETQERVVHTSADLARRFGRGDKVNDKFIDEAIRIVFRHDVMDSNRIKDGLAHELGVDRLDEILSRDQLNKINMHLHEITRIIIGRLCKSTKCQLH